MMEVVVLGSGGWFPQQQRATTSLCIRTSSALLLFDAGSGLARLAQPEWARLLEGEAEVFIFLSHLHLDHTVGLTFLPAIMSGRNTTVFVPSFEEPGDGPAWIRALVRPPFFPHRLSEFPLTLDLKAADPGVLYAGDHEVRIRRQVHPGGSLGYRVDDAVGFLTDCAPDPQAAAFVRGVDVLVHEAWGPRPDAAGPVPPPHSSAVEAAEVARDARAGELWLCHLHPMQSAAQLQGLLQVARSLFPRTYLAEDGLCRLLSFPGSSSS